jgi:hypothetical protein
MKYPKSKKTAKLYADYLTNLHNKKHFPIERADKIKNNYALNFAAVEKDELGEYIGYGWKFVE